MARGESRFAALAGEAGNIAVSGEATNLAARLQAAAGPARPGIAVYRKGSFPGSYRDPTPEKPNTGARVVYSFLRTALQRAQGKEERMIDPGGPAPDFTLSNQDGEPVSLSSLRGRWVALYFYPKADTPGCTAQACGVRDHSADYEAANAVVLGVSPDPVDELRAFADKYGLAFTLLSDESHEVADTYGVWDELQLGDLKVWGNRRSTVLVDPDGTIARSFPDVKPAEHDELVLGALAALAPAAQG